MLLILGILFNVGLLGYFKYAVFFISNVNILLGFSIPLPHITLPLAISFFTFQQIAYLIDSYNDQTKEYNFINYILFVSFFPQLIAGPIVHHKEMMLQFSSLRNKLISWENIYIGLFFIGIGLFKKVAIADTFAVWASDGFTSPQSLSFWTAWKTSLSYTTQLYFDFSGYTDMAIGSARLMNIEIPQNFNAPYIALNIQDFWRRWHITLGRFLRDYIYIPLGGNRKGKVRNYANLFLTFLIGGFWHGAGWTFVIWGAMHGLALCVHRLWTSSNLRMPKLAAWLTTFMFVNAAWVVFRADSFSTASHILGAMLDLSTVDIAPFTQNALRKIELSQAAGLAVILIFALQDIFFRTTQEWASRLRPNLIWTAGTAAALCSCLALIGQHRFTEFIYFQF
jgi:D-alanyl-lipoteichoic acid acyltransferase DltB (MBOAT superfamily)